MTGTMKLSFLLMVSILGAATQASDLSGSLFLFPSESDYVTLEPKLTTPLNSFTICLRAFTELTRHHGLLSVNSSTQGTIIQLSVNHGDSPYSVSVGDHELHFKALGHAPVRKHICATWDSDTGVTQVFLNADKLARKVMSHGYTIEGPLQITLGQKKDHLTNLFNVRQSFIGEIGDVHIWDSVLSPAGIYQAHMSNPYMTGNVVNWRHLHYETTGRVLVLPVQ